uniref:Mitochondrial 2-oxoglutarate/malate carrier protein n=1 Tax=Heliothis virescens TaxID=7102 RepID=A0A2A4JJS4_HELVI
MADKKVFPPPTSAMSKWMSLVVGGASGMMTNSIVQPADSLRTRMQLLGPAGRNLSAFTVARNIVKNEGFKGFYTGLSSTLFPQATYTSGHLGCFNVFFDKYKAKHGTPSFPKVGVGVVAGGLGTLIRNSSTLARIGTASSADGRLPQKRNYKNVFNAVTRIIREDGVRALWRGAGPPASRAMIVKGAQLGTCVQAREMLLPTLGDGSPLYTVSSMIAGFITTVSSLPSNIAKAREQNPAEAAGQVTVLKQIVKKKGALAQWSSKLPTYMKIGPMTVLIFIFLEQLNKLCFKLTV